jgi:hypothetical protein
MIQELRKYRFQFEKPYINNESLGIALFDLVITFVIAYIFQGYILKILNINRRVYYLMLIPLGVIIHILTNQNTFFNRKLFEKEWNFYKTLFLILLFFLLREFVKI